MISRVSLTHLALTFTLLMNSSFLYAAPAHVKLLYPETIDAEQGDWDILKGAISYFTLSDEDFKLQKTFHLQQPTSLEETKSYMSSRRARALKSFFAKENFNQDSKEYRIPLSFEEKIVDATQSNSSILAYLNLVRTMAIFDQVQAATKLTAQSFEEQHSLPETCHLFQKAITNAQEKKVMEKAKEKLTSSSYLEASIDNAQLLSQQLFPAANKIKSKINDLEKKIDDVKTCMSRNSYGHQLEVVRSSYYRCEREYNRLSEEKKEFEDELKHLLSFIGYKIKETPHIVAGINPEQAVYAQFPPLEGLHYFALGGVYAKEALTKAIGYFKTQTREHLKLLCQSTKIEEKDPSLLEKMDQVGKNILNPFAPPEKKPLTYVDWRELTSISYYTNLVLSQPRFSFLQKVQSHIEESKQKIASGYSGMKWTLAITLGLMTGSVAVTTASELVEGSVAYALAMSTKMSYTLGASLSLAEVLTVGSLSQNEVDGKKHKKEWLSVCVKAATCDQQEYAKAYNEYQEALSSMTIEAIATVLLTPGSFTLLRKLAKTLKPKELRQMTKMLEKAAADVSGKAMEIETKRLIEIAESKGLQLGKEALEVPVEKFLKLHRSSLTRIAKNKEMTLADIEFLAAHMHKERLPWKMIRDKLAGGCK